MPKLSADTPFLHPGAVVVCGRRGERLPQATLWNRLCDREWDTPLGEAMACGGDALMRLAAVQASPFKLTAPEQFKEFAANIDYFVFEPNIHDLNDLGWRYLAQHMDMLLPPELLKAIDPVPFGKYAMQEEQGHFTEHGYISLSGDEWNHERPAEPEKKPSIRERLEQGKK